jgi:hypothetical protein
MAMYSFDATSGAVTEATPGSPYTASTTGNSVYAATEATGQYVYLIKITEPEVNGGSQFILDQFQIIRGTAPSLNPINSQTLSYLGQMGGIYPHANSHGIAIYTTVSETNVAPGTQVPTSGHLRFHYGHGQHSLRRHCIPRNLCEQQTTPPPEQEQQPQPQAAMLSLLLAGGTFSAPQSITMSNTTAGTTNSLHDRRHYADGFVVGVLRSNFRELGNDGASESHRRESHRKHGGERELQIPNACRLFHANGYSHGDCGGVKQIVAVERDLADAGRELAVARYSISLTITDAIDHARSIVGDQQRAVRAHGHAHWAAIHIFS